MQQQGYKVQILVFQTKSAQKERVPYFHLFSYLRITYLTENEKTSDATIADGNRSRHYAHDILLRKT